MKKLLFSIAIVAAFAACNSKKDETKRDMLFLTDTSNLNNNVKADTALTAPVIAPVVAVAPVAPVRNTNTTRTRTRRSNSNTNTSSGTNNNSGVNNNGSGTVSNTPQRKRGWSKAAKGATIGGVAGAAAGAIITKSAKGAVIGGVIGAGGGYIIGRSKDKKDGRVN